MPGLFSQQPLLSQKIFPKSPYPNRLKETEDLSKDRVAGLDLETIPQVQWQDRLSPPISTLVERISPEDAKYLKDKYVLARCLTSFVFFRMTGRRIAENLNSSIKTALEAEMFRLFRRTMAQNCIIFIAAMYIERIFHGRATTIRLSAAPGVISTVFAIGMSLAVKYHFDVAIHTRYWSNNIDIGWHDFNLIELAALQVLDWNLNVSKQAFEKWMSSFVVHRAVSDNVDYSRFILLASLHAPLHCGGIEHSIDYVPSDDHAWEHFVRALIRSSSVNDVRFFAALLRGINFINRATVTVTADGITVIVEEARTLLGTAYIFSDIFDEYEYNPEGPQQSEGSQTEDTVDDAAFEIPLNTFIECLNIYGSAGGSAISNSDPKFRKWKHDDQSDGEQSDKEKKRSGRGLDQFFGSSEKRTGMRMSYEGAGCPLTLLLAEDANGPTTTCEISTFEPEPQLELPLDSEKVVLRIILKSAWLRDALSEIDSSCTTFTFIGNPPLQVQTGKHKQKVYGVAKSLLRIQASGTFGSTEMDYPDDRDVLETFECARPVSFSYRLGHILRTLRAMQSSIKTSLRIDENGLLSLQFLMPSPGTRLRGEQPAFIEFRARKLKILLIDINDAQCLALDDPQ